MGVYCFGYALVGGDIPSPPIHPCQGVANYFDCASCFPGLPMLPLLDEQCSTVLSLTNCAMNLYQLWRGVQGNPNCKVNLLLGDLEGGPKALGTRERLSLMLDFTPQPPHNVPNVQNGQRCMGPDS